VTQAAADDSDGTAPPIDRAHLARMTCGDTALERELLTLFDRQAALLLGRMRQADAAACAALAHTLAGSASGVGAAEVAAAASALEAAPGEARLAALAGAVVRARAAIAAMLAPRAD
jgi:HPt (histidine-containing phosphotransfer) domain-containing protein